MMELLIAAGARVRHRDKAGSSAMDEAAIRGMMNSVQFLAWNGAEIDEPNPYTGATPLNEAACRGDAAVVTFLLKNGANPARRDSTGATPLENSVRLRRADAVRALLALDAGASGRESGLLDEVVLRGDIESVRMLTEGGADVDARGVTGATPLDDAALKGHTEIARILLDHGAKVNARNDWGATPLHDAALGGNARVAELLIDRGADVNARESESGSTPLYSAAAMGHAEMAQLLLEHGADPGIANKEGKNAVRAAKDNGFTGLAASLQQYSQSPADARAAALRARFADR